MHRQTAVRPVAPGLRGETMPAIVDRLHHYATAVSDPTRGMILVELDRNGEATATQLARKLGLTANNVYHHMRILLQLGVVDPPRVVPGQTYVEKFYQINPDTRAALRLDPGWYDQSREGRSAEDRKSIVISLLQTMAHLLRQAARDYEALDAETFDDQIRDDAVIMLSLNRIGRPELESRVGVLRQLLESEAREFAGEGTPRTDLMLMAALPLFWNANSESVT